MKLLYFFNLSHPLLHLPQLSRLLPLLLVCIVAHEELLSGPDLLLLMQFLLSLQPLPIAGLLKVNLKLNVLAECRV